MFFEIYGADLKVKAAINGSVFKLNIELPLDKGGRDRHIAFIFSTNNFYIINHELKYTKIPDKGTDIDTVSLALDDEMMNLLNLCLKKNISKFKSIKIYVELCEIVESMKKELEAKECL